MAMRDVPPHALSTNSTEEKPMRLFKRRRDEEALRCAGCGERAPDGAFECSMCGEQLDPKREAALRTPGGKAREVARRWG